MALADLMTHKTSKMDESVMALWEDAMPHLLNVKLHALRHSPNIVLFDHSIRSYLLYAGVPPELIYPIMRMNGYHHNGDLLHEDEQILIPEVGAMETILKSLLARTS